MAFKKKFKKFGNIVTAIAPPIAAGGIISAVTGDPATLLAAGAGAVTGVAAKVAASKFIKPPLDKPGFTNFPKRKRRRRK